MNVAGKIRRKLASYLSRHADWLRLLTTVRGNTVTDMAKLYGSAALAPLTALRELGWYRPPVLLADMQLREPRTGVFGIRSGTDDIFHIMWWREPKLFKLLEDSLQPGDTFVDAGANIGFYSLLASRLVGPSGQVHSFEMMPATATMLRSNIAASGRSNVTVHEAALSDVSGEFVEASFNPRFLGQASVTSTLGAARTQTVRVRTTRFDDEPLPDRIKLMKIDLEGNELRALQGGHDLLRRTEMIVFENTMKESLINDLLEREGFVIEHLEHDDFVARKLHNASSH